MICPVCGAECHPIPEVGGVPRALYTKERVEQLEAELSGLRNELKILVRISERELLELVAAREIVESARETCYRVEQQATADLIAKYDAVRSGE